MHLMFFSLMALGKKTKVFHLTEQRQHKMKSENVYFFSNISGNDFPTAEVLFWK